MNTIKTRLLIIFSCIALIIAISGTVIFFNEQEIRREVRMIADGSSQEALSSSKIHFTLDHIKFDALIWPMLDAREQAEVQKRIMRDIRAIERDLEHWNRAISLYGASNHDFIEVSTRFHNMKRPLLAYLARSHADGNMAQKYRTFRKELMPFLYAVEHALGPGIEASSIELVGHIAHVDTMTSRNAQLIIIISIVAILSAIILGILISSNIQKSIHVFLSGIQNLIEGDRGHHLQMTSRLREIVSLTDAFNTMSDKLRDTVISRDYFTAITDSMFDFIFVVAIDGKILFVNKSVKDRLLSGDQALIGTYITQYVIHESGDKHLKLHMRYLTGKSIGQYLFQKDNGESVPLEISVSVLDEPNGQNALILVARDVSKRLAHEQRLREEMDFSKLLLESTGDGIYGVDNQGRCTFLNTAASKLLGFKPSEAKGENMHTLIHHTRVDGEGHPVKRCTVHHTLLSGTGVRRDDELFWRKDGASFPVEYSSHPVYKDSVQIGGVVVFQDISERHKLNKNLQHMANFDFLTGMPNRPHFREKLKEAIKRSQRNATLLGVFFIDLDNFKQVNDTFGHTFGDKLLVAIANRCRGCLRGTDTAARFGGDEFVLMAENIERVEDLEMVAKKVIHKISDEAYLIDARRFEITASIGVSIYPFLETEEELYKASDLAMYAAKKRGRNRYTFYTHAMGQVSSKYSRIEAEIRSALKEERFELWYQPKVNLDSQRLVGAEALIRMRDQAGQYIMPGDFIPIAEESGLIQEVGDWVMKTAFMDSCRWRQKGYDLMIAINVATQQLYDANVIEKLDILLKEAAISGIGLELELTESSIIANLATIQAVLEQLRIRGFKIAIDDFGTGYSSLSYLKILKVDTLKIDQSFVRDMEKDSDDEAIVQAILTLGMQLNFEIVAEGIETEAQKQLLKKMGCHLGQGYYFSKPMHKEQFEALLADKERWHFT